MLLRSVRPTARQRCTDLDILRNVRIIVDTTFVPLPKNTFVREDYHQKSPTKAAWKYEIACDFSHRIISCSRGFHGGQHDMRIIRESGLLKQQSDTSQIMGDKGYKGKLGIVVPASKRAKVSREVQQLEEEKQRGHELQSERAAIENVNQRVKQWAVANEVWTGVGLRLRSSICLIDLNAQEVYSLVSERMLSTTYLIEVDSGSFDLARDSHDAYEESRTRLMLDKPQTSAGSHFYPASG